MMEKWIGKVAVVTGASAGIGEAISRQLAVEGMIVIGCARNVAKIDVRGHDTCAPISIAKYCSLSSRND